MNNQRPQVELPLSADMLAGVADHTLLKPEADAAAIEAVCAEALDIGAWSVCVNGAWVPTASAALEGGATSVCAVVGFPLGAMASRAKGHEAALAVADGAEEIDMVINLGHALDQQWTQVGSDIAAVRAALDGIVLKVIIESAALPDEAIVNACRTAVDAGADFVKTSTGFHPAGGATVEAVRVMRETVGPALGVKASGGIRDLARAEAMIEAGADRLGLSGTVAIIDEIHARS